MQIDYIRIGSHFRKAREKMNLTQAQIAEKIGVADNTYNCMERGQMPMNLKRIIQLCILFGITPGSVLNDCCDDLIDNAYEDVLPESDDKRELRLLVDKCSDETAYLVNAVGQTLYYAHRKKRNR